MGEQMKNCYGAKEVVLSIKALRTAIRTRQKLLYPVDGVDLELPKGRILGLVGESGCGKSMMANSVMGLLPPNAFVESGSVRFKENNLLSYSKEELRKLHGDRMTFIFQDPMTSLNPVMRVGKQVEEVLKLHQSLSKNEAKEKVLEMFRAMGIPEPERRYNCYPHELSGGLRQRVMISAAMICRPDLLIADEPTTALDVTIEAQILQYMKKLQREEGTSVVLITHDLGVVAEICDLVYVMYAGKIVEQAPVNELFHNPVHPYTIGLMNSLPGRNVGRKLKSIPGIVPTLDQMPEGCRFAPRCEFACEKCCGQVPELAEIRENHFCRCFFAKGGVAQ